MRARTRTTAISATVAAALVAIGVSTVVLVPSAHAEVVSNLAYAPAQPAGSQGHLLDLYLPSGTTPRPLVIWTSGSAWMSDSGKSGASSIASTFNSRGYAVAGVSVGRFWESKQHFS